MQRHRYLLPRLHVDAALAAGSHLALPEAAAHHAMRVLRLEAGETLVLFNGGGGEYAARIESTGKTGVVVRIEAFSPTERESPLAVTLVQGLSSGERMDLTVQKSVELGVHAIQPLVAEKSVVRLAGERAAARCEHWRRVAIAACEQCGRNRVPQILPLLPFARYVAPAEALKLVLAPDAGMGVKQALGEGAAAIVLAVGPEAGFSEAEERSLVAAGFKPVSLGPRILRTETAAPAALAALNALRGDF
ncbi:MAG: 16S rRNA (uracil(1498)-N(3))-methyltransferase [Betaproteobacteria bacterium]|nr:MAG: 16S rRNA (uracil(1498)-N(3))-methyltransferase [Betaproteobacteria bacterium]